MVKSGVGIVNNKFGVTKVYEKKSFCLGLEKTNKKFLWLAYTHTFVVRENSY